jgi:hypothetical protein
MELINKYEGAVFFVDLLGMGALTKRQIQLEDEDYVEWIGQYNLENSPQYLAASILAEFRRILIELDETYQNVTVSQLSDCAFIWSQDIKEVVLFTATFMNLALENGLLCRGGLTYGEIIETNDNHKLGRFIVGQAVTDAVKLEGIPKGARVLIDQGFPQAIWENNKTFGDKIYPLFSPFTNPLDYEVYDEFKWYLVPYDILSEKDLRIIDKAERIEYTKNRLYLASQIRYSPKFSWNSKSKPGLIQLKATISFLSESNLLNVSHNFDWTDIGGKRTYKNIENQNRIILEDEDYKIIK